MKDVGDALTIKTLRTMFFKDPQTTLGIDKILFLNTNQGIASASYEAKKEMCHSGGIVQGGFITGWLDAVMALACMAKCGTEGRHTGSRRSVDQAALKVVERCL